MKKLLVLLMALTFVLILSACEIGDPEPEPTWQDNCGEGVVVEPENAGFETGDLSGWTASGDAFSDDLITSMETFWSEEVPFGHEGNWHLYGRGFDDTHPEEMTGTLTSSSFTLCGDGLISFKIGAGRDQEKVFVEVRLVDGDQLIAKQANDEFADFSGVVDPNQAIMGIAFVNNYAEYELDLSDVDGVDYRGEEMYVVLVDNDDDGDFGMINFDDLRTYYVDGVAAVQTPGTKYTKEKTFDCATVTAPSMYDVINGDFEEGNLCGWTPDGLAFSYKNVNDAEYFWETRPYNHNGDYHLDGFTGADEVEVGTLTSSTFELGGTGWITFMLAGGMNQVDTYLAVFDASDASEIVRVSNSEFSDPDQSLNYQEYRLDLSAYIGKDLYLVLVDNASSGPFGAISLDNVDTYHETVPTAGVLSRPAVKIDCGDVTLEAPSEYDIVNGDFESGTICGWTVEVFNEEPQAFINEAVVDTEFFWEIRPYSFDGMYFYNGFSVGENKAGTLVSSTFIVGGSGWISYKLGGGMDQSLAYLAVYDATNDTELVRFSNMYFNDPHTALELLPYRADLSAYLGQDVYLKFVDEDIDGGFGALTIDSVVTMHTGVPEGYLAQETATDCSAVEAATIYDVINGDFETGNLCGWTIDYSAGFAFSPDMVTDATTWWAEEIPYNHDGTYHVQGITNVSEAATGRLVSSTFELGGSGWISFKLGAGADVNTNYIVVRNADTNEVVAVYGNTEFEDINFPNVDQGLKLNNYVAYKADLVAEGASLGDNLYIEVIDIDSDGNWGMMNIDSVDTTHDAEPTEGTLATNNLATVAPDDYSVVNGGFETGDLTGWTVTGEAFDSLGILRDTYYWNEHISFNKDGQYHFTGWATAGGEAATGTLTSSVFELGGSGMMTFKLGGNGGYISIFASDGTELARFENSEFADINFPFVDQGLVLANMVLYSVDLTQYATIGDDLYIQITDTKESDWGLMVFDSFITNYSDAADVPAEAVVAINIYTVLLEVNGTQDFEIQVGDALPDFETGVTATDNEFGEVTLVIDSSAVDVNTAGVYDVVYTATDLAGNVATVTVTVTVSEADVTNPVLMGVPSEVYVLLNGVAPDYAFGVTASDNIDGDITASITVDSSLVDITTLGDYTATVSVSDAADNSVSVDVTVHVVDMLPTVENPGFETGDYTGWTSTDPVFTDGLTTDTTWWAEAITYNKEGMYHYSAFNSAAGEPGMGVLTSSTFRLSGSGWMTFKLGGNGGYVAIMTTDGAELARFYNTEFCDCNFPNVDQGMNLANMVDYKVNLLNYASLGDELYIKVVDEKDSGWGIMTFDLFNTYYGDAVDVPAEAVLATPHYQPQNLGFETGDFSGWTSTDPVFQEGLTTDQTWWAENITYNKDGMYHYSAWNTTVNEPGMGALQSTTFVLGGSGMMTFKLGGNGGYVSIKASDGTELARFSNTEFCDCNFPNVDQGMNLANMVLYKVDLTLYASLGDTLSIEVVDNASSGWGIMTFDSFQTYYEDAVDISADAVIAVNQLT